MNKGRNDEQPPLDLTLTSTFSTFSSLESRTRNLRPPLLWVHREFEVSVTSRTPNLAKRSALNKSSKRSALSKRTRTLGHYHTEPYTRPEIFTAPRVPLRASERENISAAIERFIFADFIMVKKAAVTTAVRSSSRTTKAPLRHRPGAGEGVPTELLELIHSVATSGEPALSVPPPCHICASSTSSASQLPGNPLCLLRATLSRRSRRYCPDLTRVADLTALPLTSCHSSGLTGA